MTLPSAAVNTVPRMSCVSFHLMPVGELNDTSLPPGKCVTSDWDSRVVVEVDRGSLHGLHPVATIQLLVPLRTQLASRLTQRMRRGPTAWMGRNPLCIRVNNPQDSIFAQSD